MNKVKVFEELLTKFETEEIKSYCEDMINDIPDRLYLEDKYQKEYSYRKSIEKGA